MDTFEHQISMCWEWESKNKPGDQQQCWEEKFCWRQLSTLHLEWMSTLGSLNFHRRSLLKIKKMHAKRQEAWSNMPWIFTMNSSSYFRLCLKKDRDWDINLSRFMITIILIIKKKKKLNQRSTKWLNAMWHFSLAQANITWLVWRRRLIQSKWHGQAL